MTVLETEDEGRMGVETRRVYFDCHVYDLLARPGHESVRERLLGAIRTGECSVYGSLASIEELGPVAGRDASRYRNLLDCFWACVRMNLLLDRALLLQAELRKSDRLAMREACFDNHSINHTIKPASYDEPQMRSISEEVIQKKQHDAEDMNKTFREVERKVASVIQDVAERKHRGGDVEHQAWLNAVSNKEIQDWLNTLRSRHSACCIHWRRAPCTSALIGWMIARAKMNLLSGKQYERSAGHDRDHLISATQTGTLVTNDQVLAKTVAFIQVPLATVQTADEFFDSLLSPDGG